MGATTGIDLIIGGRLINQRTSAWGDLVLTHRRAGDSWEATVDLALGPRDRGRWLRKGDLAEVRVFGCPRWAGQVLDGIDTDGQLVLTGAVREFEGPAPLDGAGLATNIVDTAINAAIARGVVHAVLPSSISTTAEGDPSADPTSSSLTLGQLIDLHFDAQPTPQSWYVDPRRVIRWAPIATVPTFYVMPGAAELTWSAQDSADRIVGGWFDATGAPHIASVGTGNQEQKVILTETGTGPLDTTTATNLLQRILTADQAGTWSSNIEITADLITARGGVVPHPSMVRAGCMVRLLDHPDPRPGRTGLPYTDVVIDESSWATADGTLTLTPMGTLATSEQVMAEIGAQVA